MKRNQFILLIIASLCFGIKDAKSQWRIGPHLGLNVSTITNPSSVSQTIKIQNIEGIKAFRAGCLVEYAPGLKLSLQTGLSYSGMGADYKIYNTNYGISSRTIQTRLNYVSVPVEGHYALKNSSSKISLFGGMDLNFLVYGSTDGGDDSKAYSFFDPTLKLGTQIIFSPGLGLRLDYGFGTANTFKDVYPDFFNDPIELKNKNRCIGISVFWLLGGSGII